MRYPDHPGTCRNARRIRRGAAAVEFALLLPVLMLLTLGAVDFGQCCYQGIAVQNAARAGAQYGIMNPYSASTLSAWQSAIQAAARTEMQDQTNYNPNQLTVTSRGFIGATDTASGLRRVQVTASYPFRTVVNWPGIPSTLTLTRTVEARIIR